MSLADELKQLNIDMTYNGKAYQTFYQIGLTMPFLFFIAEDRFGNIDYLSHLSENELENLSPIRHKNVLDKVGGIYKDYMNFIFLIDTLNLDWFEGLELTIRGDGYINNYPVDFYINNKDVFIKYCEFILCKNDYNFSPSKEEIKYAKKDALTHTGLELEQVFSI